MKLIYSSRRVEMQCINSKDALKLFGGNKGLAISLLARVNALESARDIRDIECQRFFRFHNLRNKQRDLKGYFAIDVKTIKEPWRIILQPLDENEKIFDPYRIDEIADKVKVVKIVEVSKHYE